MNRDLQTIFDYHERTKHTTQRYARSLGYLDWSTQPDPYRVYQGAEEVLMPLSFDNTTPPYHLLDTNDVPSAPLCIESVSQLLQFSMGIAAHKAANGNRWSVRCNASSGNLHPTETYLVLPPSTITQQTSIIHYRVKNHSLEVLAELDTKFWEQMPRDSFLIGFSSIAWREVWKYGERGFRYVHLDVGHAFQSLAVSAKMLGWKISKIEGISQDDLSTLFGLNQDGRFFEDETPDIIAVVSKQGINNLSLNSLIENVPLQFNSIANKLSPSMHSWEIIPQIEQATSSLGKSQAKVSRDDIEKLPTKESKDVILQRRSVHIMDKDASKISKEQFHTILRSVSGSLDGRENATHLCLMLHRVDEYKNGLYLLIRNEKDFESLRQQMHHDFLWETTSLANLYFLEARDLQMASKAISCTQDIASDGAFSLGMLCNFSQQLQEFGARRYKELYWECGMIGQQLYLEATSLGLSGTGIGCFLDDTMHYMLGLKSNLFQILYHFTVGRGYVDSRIQTEPAYER